MAKYDAQNSVHARPQYKVDARPRDLPRIFRRRLIASLENSRMNSWRQVAKASDCSPSLLQSIARGDYDNSDKGPGLFGAYRAARTLDVSLDDLAPPQKRPSVGCFLATYSGFDTPIEKFGAMLDYCDVYDEPYKGLTQIVRLGPKSLLAERSEILDPALLQIEFERWPTARRRRIFNRQLRAWKTGALTELEFFDVRFENSERAVRVSFILAACRVVDFDRIQRLLVFCEPMAHEN